MYNIITVSNDGIVTSMQQTGGDYTLSSNQYFVPDYDESLVGQIRNGNGTFTQPLAQPDMRITKLAFRNRFTFAEKVTIEDVAKTDTQVKVLLDDQKSATYIDISRADTAAGLDLLVTKGLLTQQRRDEILNTAINDEDERP